MFPLAARDIEDLSAKGGPWSVVRLGIGCDNRHHRVEGNTVFVFGGMSFDVAPPTVFPTDDAALEYSVFCPSCFGPESAKLPGLLLGDRAFCAEWTHKFRRDRWVDVSVRVSEGLMAATIDGCTVVETPGTDTDTLLTAARIEIVMDRNAVVAFKDFSLSLRGESFRTNALGASGHSGDVPVAPEPVERVDDDIDDRRDETEDSPEQGVAVALVRDAGDPEVEHEVEECEDEA